MGDGTVERLFTKIEALQREVARLIALAEAKNELCTRQEKILEEHARRIESLENKSNNFSGGVNVAAWLATFAVALWGVIGK